MTQKFRKNISFIHYIHIIYSHVQTIQDGPKIGTIFVRLNFTKY